MRANTIVWTLVATLLVVAGILIACGGPAAPGTTEPAGGTPPAAPPTEAVHEQPTVQPPAGDGAALLEERCTVCHSLDRVTQVHKTRQEWEQTVTRMAGQGARLNDDEKATLITYLAETYTLQAPTPPETCPSCKEKCIFIDATCYTPECGGPGNINPQIGQK